MRQSSTRWILSLIVFCLVASLPGIANADLLKVWVSGRGDYVDSTGDVFTSFENPYGGGLEAGLEVIGITAFGEGLIMAPDHYLFTLNAGFDFNFGEEVRLSLGAFTGPILFLFPESEVESVDFSQLTSDQRAAIEDATGKTVEEAEEEFNTFSEKEQDLSRLAFGWNLARLRTTLDFQLFPAFYLGVAGQAGYHYLLTGEEAAAGAKNEAINNYSEEYPELPDDVVEALREAVGAEPVDRDELNGFNYDVNLYLRFEFGT